MKAVRIVKIALICVALFIVPSLMFSLKIQVENDKQEVFTKKSAKKPIVVSVQDDKGHPLQGYTVKVIPFSEKLGKMSNKNPVTDKNGKTSFRFTAGNKKMGNIVLNFQVLDKQNKLVGNKTGSLLVLDIITIIFTVIGGLALFLFGINLMSEGLQTVAGERLKSILNFLTKNRVMGVGLGFVITAIIQSSSATTVMVIGFINAGLMNLTQSVGVIMGANIGTTITAQLIAFKLSAVALPAIALGFFVMIFSKNSRAKFWGQVILGFGLLFFGMKMMSGILKPLAYSQSITAAFINFSRSPWLGLLVGTVATMIVQSSSATVGLVMALTGAGLIDISGMFPIILGTNIGTTITAQIAALSSNKAAKQAAWVHTIFNVLGSLMMLGLISIRDSSGVSYYYRLLDVITNGKLKQVNGQLFTSGNMQRFVANSHMVFNIFATAIFLPFGVVLAKIATWLVPAKTETLFEYLEPHLLDTPAIALIQTKKEIGRMLTIATDMFDTATKSLTAGKPPDMDKINEKEQLLDTLQYETSQYLVELTKRPLVEEEANQIPKLMHSANDIERVGDLSENVAYLSKRLAKHGTKLSKNEREHIREIKELLIAMMQEIIAEIPKERAAKFEKIMRYEDKVNKFHKKTRKKYFSELARMKDKSEISAGLIFIDTINFLEKIGDHLTNVCLGFIHLRERMGD